MKRILNAINKDLQTMNFYSALYVSLSLIDACAKIEKSSLGGIKYHYVDWLNEYYLPLFELDMSNPIVSANAIYQLRCSVLHESTNYIDQNNRKKYPDIMNLYQFILTNTSSHRNKSIVSNNKETIEEIQLNIVSFINEIVKSISEWMVSKREDEYKLKFSIETETWSSTTINGAGGFKDCY